jgi:stage III sporulation protein AB
MSLMVKWFGSALILMGCGGIGFYTAANHNREVRNLRKLCAVLDYMACELQYKLTPLPELCRHAAQETDGALKRLLHRFSEELDDQISPHVRTCMEAALSKSPQLPEITVRCIRHFATGLGRFDLQGQLQSLESTREVCRLHLEDLENNREVRLRTYQTLGLCGGAALVILFA